MVTHESKGVPFCRLQIVYPLNFTLFLVFTLLYFTSSGFTPDNQGKAYEKNQKANQVPVQNKKVDPYTAEIHIEKIQAGTLIKGVFLNNSNERVKFVYRLTMHKKGGSGRSSSSQGGVFVAEPMEKKSLCEMHLNLLIGDVFSVSLQIFHGQELIAERFIRSSFDS